MNLLGQEAGPTAQRPVQQFSFLSLACFLFLLPVPGNCGEKICKVGSDIAGIEIVQVPSPRRFVSPPHGAMGVSTLYYFDDDSALESPLLRDALESSGLSTFRFPGGELADNYDWETHSLERPRAWPGEAANSTGRAERTDFREFLEFARENAVDDLFFVVNVDGAFRAKGDHQENIRRYAEKAARWVAAVKRSGFKVKYWEIGNEPELSGSLPLTAAEYARALNAFSDVMRAVDPSVKIGAAGPNSVEKVGFADRLTAEQLTYLRAHGGNHRTACEGLSPPQCIKQIRRVVPGNAKAEPWWSTLAEQAGNSFDFVAVHRYTLVNPHQAKHRDGRMLLTARLQRLGNFLEARLRRPVPVALTEWNTPSQRERPTTEIEHLLEIAVQLGNNLAARVEFMHYWPMRAPNDDFRPMFLADGSPSPIARLHALVREIVADSAIAEQMPAPELYLLHANSDDRSSLLAVNLNETPRTLRWPRKKNAADDLTVLRLTGNDIGEVVESRCNAQLPAGESVELVIPPHSAAVASISHPR